MASVVVVEDDPAIRRGLIRGLTERGYAVTSYPSGLPALEHVVKERPDVVVLDLGLPDVDGRKLLAMIRAVSDVPVIVVTARDDDQSIVATLDEGADDYVVKPFGIEQVAARIRAVLRRSASEAAGDRIEIGELVIDPRARRATLAGEEIELARREFDLLLALASRAGEVVTKRELLSEVWQQPYGGADRTLDVHLSWLRRKLGETAAEPRYLHTVRGVGVRLTAPTESRAG
ncbi:response regulator transcription factor [Nocardioides pelophilus]|uniref:response regulator transcription factor n=1 Tax=Nocardioides pelophilus TaxID=2172019 RepID=UPI0016017EB4|nr:response regulator transcription factor [Nocardioides pelophilus]